MNITTNFMKNGCLNHKLLTSRIINRQATHFLGKKICYILFVESELKHALDMHWSRFLV